MRENELGVSEGHVGFLFLSEETVPGAMSVSSLLGLSDSWPHFPPPTVNFCLRYVPLWTLLFFTGITHDV